MSQNRTPGFTIRTNDAANTLASKFVRSVEQPNPAPEPNYKDDLIDRINIEQNASLTDGPTTIIDVQPDYRYILITIIYHVIRVYAVLDQRNNPLITPASLTAYCLSIVYGFALISDSENIRTQKSSYADDFMDNPSRRDLLIELERSYVPPFLKNVLTGLMPTFDPRRPNISFVNTFAGFYGSYDYGKSFPITSFIKAHHLVATRPSNSNPVTIFNDWLQLPLTEGSPEIFNANLYGIGNATGNYDNWLVQRVHALFNPVTSRSNTNRPTFSPIVTFPLTVKSWEFNPYIYLLGADSENISNMTTFIKSMSFIINEQLTNSTQLGSMFSVTSGIQIMTHFYHGPALPTWHWLQVKPTEKELSATNFAAIIKFLQDPTSDEKTSLPYPDKDDVIDTSLYLVDKNGKNNDSPIVYISFDSDEHVTPDVRYFDPYNYNPSSLVFTIMTGLSIETEEIDGFTVPQPLANVSLYTDNSHILESAVPLNLIKPAKDVGDITVLDLVQRVEHDSSAPTIGVSLRDLSTNRLPYFNTHVKDTKPAIPYGFTPLHHIDRFKRGFTHFGYQIQSPEHKMEANVPNNLLYAWSSYRYVNKNAPKVTLKTSKIYMLLNFRTVYGTNVTLSQSVHPSRLIPLA